MYTQCSTIRGRKSDLIFFLGAVNLGNAGNAEESRAQHITRGAGPIFLSYLECDSSDNYLLECDSRSVAGIPKSSCSHFRDAAVHCEGIKKGDLYICVYVIKLPSAPCIGDL